MPLSTHEFIDKGKNKVSNVKFPSGTGLSDSAENAGYRLHAIPLSPSRMTGWKERLATWRTLRDAPVYEEDGRARAARRSETITRRLVSVHHTTQYGHVFSNKRIPRDVTAASMGRYEADLIVITPRRIVNLEVKNWSGSLRVQGDQWMQVRRSGEQVVHENLLAYNRDKLRALRAYLTHCGVDLPAERFHQAVVFANPNLKIDPIIKGHPAVLELADLGSVLGAGTGAARHMAAKLVQLLTDAETAAALSENLLKVIPATQMKTAAKAIGELRTWDRVTLRGGRTLQGDVIWMRLFGNKAPAAAFNPGGEAKFSWRRDLIGGFRWVVLDEPAGYMKGSLFTNQHYAPKRIVPLDHEACVCFHEPGSPTPSIIALSHVEHMQIG